VACLIALPATAVLRALAGFDRDLAEHGVTERYSESGMSALIQLVGDEIAGIDRRASAGGGEAPRLRGIADAGRRVLARVSELKDPSAASAAYPALKSLLYSMRTAAGGVRHGHKVETALRVLGNLKLEIPYLSPDERTRPLTPAEVALEAANLADPVTGRRYGDPAELAGLSSDEVSRLDVGPDDYLWYDEKELGELKAQHGGAWRALEARVETRVSGKIQRPYALESARRILRFRDIGSSGTSPKVYAEDLHGRAWMVKWGDEVQTEPLANHLYAELGGRFTDLVYANSSGRADLVLVLEADRKGNAEDECSSISTFEELRRCLRVSKFKFDVSAHVADHGVITESMLREEPFASAKAPTAHLVGREFVTFNESLVEFQAEGSDGFERLGAAPMSARGVRSDRAKRGLAVFTYWIHNKDAKDDNNKGLVDAANATYVEYVHDMGASLGNAFVSGNPNLLTVGEDFVRRRGHTVRFRGDMLYVPKTFDATTCADALWMARKIGRLTPEEIVGAAAATRWPDFQRDVVASRLVARRNDLVRAFEVADPMPWTVPRKVVSLRTPADRLDAVRHYNLAITTSGDEEEAREQLDGFMATCGITFDDDGVTTYEDPVDIVRASSDSREETVLRTSPCEKSVLVAWLEQTVHPAGLSRRLRRGSDDKPLRRCRPTKKSLNLSE
jgi:hypothetical protein